MVSLSEFLVFTGSFLVLTLIFRERKGKRKDGLEYPPSLPTVPILGSVPFMLKNLRNLPIFFLEKSYELGPVFNATFGNRYSDKMRILEPDIAFILTIID